MHNIDDVTAAGTKGYDVIAFSWDIIDICQYKCSYCAAVDFNKHLFDKNDRVAYKNVLKRLNMNNFKYPFQIELIGGEPTLHPELPAILEGLSSIDHCIRVELITNLAKPEPFFAQFNDPKYSKVVVSPSYHPEYYTQKFLDKCLAINNYKHIRVIPIVNLSDEEKNWKDTVELLKKFDEHKIRFGLNFLIEIPGENRTESFFKPNYTPEFYEYFKEWLERTECFEVDKELDFAIQDSHVGDAPCQVIAKNIKYTINGKTEYLDETEIVRDSLHQFKGWKCDARMYYITMGGDILHHCTREKLDFMCTKEDIFQQVTCPINCCDCDTKYHYYKERPS